jgi:hypothetical protein
MRTAHELSRRHARWTASLLERLEPGTVVPESAGLTAARLAGLFGETT